MEKESKGMQENIVLLQLLEKHLEELKQQGALLENKFIELETTKQITEDMKKMKDSQDVMIPLGSGIYSYGKITDTDLVLLGDYLSCGFAEISKDRRRAEGAFEACGGRDKRGEGEGEKDWHRH